MKYVNVAIDNRTDQTDVLYTYGTSIEDIKVGDKVKVPFARGNRVKEAYVFKVMEEAEQPIKGLKMVAEKDPDVSLNEEMISTCVWMRSRYLCRYIEGVKCFTPAGSPSKRGKKRDPFKGLSVDTQKEKLLTEEQALAMKQIAPAIGRSHHHVFLVHGVTGSGKTELYMQVISECIKQHKTAIMLVPEIALTTQTISRFLSRFGSERMAILHSKLSLGQRYDEWKRVQKGEVDIVIGARSAVFAPLEHIGAIILDEEHETTYKSDMAPKYDTLEVAVKRAMAHKAVVLLGSATPSLGSYYLAEKGQFTKLSLLKRYNGVALPTVEIKDMREELKRGNKSMFSVALYEEMQGCLDKKQQVILFLNRRGYSTFISCRNCGYVMRCPECGIAMTYHKTQEQAVCHFCGRHQLIPKICPDCQSKYLKYFGMGTEKVEEAVKQMFPQASVSRLDFDTAKGKGSTDQILGAFQRGKTDILIGTQLVAKGLDFPNVGLVGIVSADVSLNIPDYRSPERTFALITQAAGRAGRGDTPGRVIIQSYTPEHYAILAAKEHDYQGFYRQELRLREQIGYPPFSDLFQMIISGEKDEQAGVMASEFAQALRLRLAKDKASVLGPNPAPMSKVNGYYRYQILIKAKTGRRRGYAAILGELKQQLFVQNKNDCLLSIDINPYSFV